MVCGLAMKLSVLCSVVLVCSKLGSCTYLSQLVDCLTRPTLLGTAVGLSPNVTRTIHGVVLAASTGTGVPAEAAGAAGAHHKTVDTQAAAALAAPCSAASRATASTTACRAAALCVGASVSMQRVPQLCDEGWLVGSGVAVKLVAGEPGEGVCMLALEMVPGCAGI